MSEFEVTFWDAGGSREYTETYQAGSFAEALALAERERAIAEHDGATWRIVDVCEAIYNTEEAFSRIAWIPKSNAVLDEIE
jgi:hypothetical protein